MSTVTTEKHTKLENLVAEKLELAQALERASKTVKAGKIRLTEINADIKKHKMHRENFRKSCIECGYVSEIY